MKFEYVGDKPDEILAYAYSVLDTMREALVILDERLHVLSANAAFFRIFELDETDVINRPLLELSEIRLNVSPPRQPLERLLRQDDGFKDVEIEIQLKSGARKTILANARRLDASTGSDSTKVLFAAQDITDLQNTRRALESLQQELEERFRRRTSELESANAELEAFAYSVSHDLRSPLRAMAGFSRALEEDYEDLLDEEGKTYIRHIQNGADKMSNLIDDLLKLSRVSRGEMRYEKVDLSAIATNLVQELERADPDRKVSVDIEDGLVVEGDEALLTVVLRNLLENAWKYTSYEPHARIHVAAEQRSDGAVFQVIDNGVGFDMTYVDKLFKPFQRLHSAHEFEGNGIGLATTYRILRRHGGDIWCEGEIGKGATFYFTLKR